MQKVVREDVTERSLIKGGCKEVYYSMIFIHDAKHGVCGQYHNYCRFDYTFGMPNIFKLIPCSLTTYGTQ